MTAVRDRVETVRTVFTRATLAPVLLRAALGATVLLAFAVAYPVEVLVSRVGVALLLVAVLPALAPRGHAPTLAVLVGLAGWLLATTGYGVPVQLWRLLAVGSLLYLAHALAALVAAVPYDVLLAPEVVVRWLLRTGLVLLASAVLVVLLLTVAGRAAGQPFLLAAVAGLAVAVSATALLTWLVKRR
ncbi:hypothetical protein O7632_06905 [Solwaraspora sp. WMMD406]|uniref:hypothetical protein n=1 Tax=Solwaraspora sp. WMMD406 TaxID=3016095 RepID=UPI002417F453|nr:hypothetical protein [Solwaraspora sp. WMMD406]MDG4763839.1 hypothetical protein [Solwaraspora sp. WMMD406]